MEYNLIMTKGLKLASYERPGNHASLFFIHGNSSNASAFEDVWRQPALRDYHLLSLDLPGHGRSARATDVSAYTMSSLGKLIAEIIQEKHVHNAILIGHSMGGHIALSALNFTDRVAGIALAGTAPVEGAQDLPNAYVISEAVQTVFKADVSDTEIADFCRNAVHQQERAPILVQAFHGTDKRFREQMGLELSRHFGSPEFRSEVRLLRDSAIPVCLIHGEEEKVVNPHYLSSLAGLNLFQNKIHLIGGAGHGVPFEEPEKYSRVLAAFAAHLRSVRA